MITATRAIGAKRSNSARSSLSFWQFCAKQLSCNFWINILQQLHRQLKSTKIFLTIKQKKLSLAYPKSHFQILTSPITTDFVMESWDIWLYTKRKPANWFLKNFDKRLELSRKVDDCLPAVLTMKKCTKLMIFLTDVLYASCVH